MQKYELMLVTTADFPHEDEKKRTDLVKKLLSDQTISDLVIVDMGKKHLAYEIQKKTEGCYFLVTFAGEGVNIGAIEQQVKLQLMVLRYLLTKKD